MESGYTTPAVSAVLVDTNAILTEIGEGVGSTLDAMTIDIQNKIGVPAGASVSADILAQDTKLGVPAGASVSADILAQDTKLGAPAGASVSADLAAIKLDTANGLVATDAARKFTGYKKVYLVAGATVLAADPTVTLVDGTVVTGDTAGVYNIAAVYDIDFGCAYGEVTTAAKIWAYLSRRGVCSGISTGNTKYSVCPLSSVTAIGADVSAVVGVIDITADAGGAGTTNTIVSGKLVATADTVTMGNVSGNAGFKLILSATNNLNLETTTAGTFDASYVEVAFVRV